MAESLRILILEDNPADAELIRLELQEAGITFTSEVVITEGEYLQAIQDCRPDLILSDYDLPTYNGALALAEARKRCPDTPFILVTGAVTEDRAIDILTQGAKDYVLKNRLEQRLVPAVKRALAEAEEHQARKHAEAELREANRTLEERVKTRTAELEAEVAVRKKIADALQMSERRERERAEELATILDAVPTPVILVHDPDSTHMTGNRSADELLRQQRGSETSLSAPPEVKPRHFKAFKGGRELKLDELPAQRAARGEHVKDFDFSLVFDDGATRYLLGYGTPLLDKQQRPRGAVHVLVDITERKLAEDALKLNAAIMETVAEGIFLIGLDDNIIKWTNRKFEQLFGYGPGEMVGMHVDKVNAPTERTPTETRISIVDVLRQAGEWHGEIENIRKDGTRFWCHIHVSLFNHPEFGTVMVSAHTDITERKRTEQALRTSEEKFSKAFRTSPNAITITRLSDGRIIEGNESAYELIGYSHEEVLGKTTAELNIWANPDDRQRLVAGLAANGSVKNEEFVLQKKDKTPIYVNLSASLITINNEQCFICSFVDITERKLFEKELRTKERLFQDVIDGSTSPIFLKDLDGKFITINASLERMLGMSREEIKGKTDYDIAPKELADYWRTHDKHVMATGKSIQIDEAADLPDGHHIFLANKFPLVDSDGKLYGVGAISHDITDRKNEEEIMQRRTAELESAVAELDSFTYSVSHDLRAPLRAIDGYSQMLLKEAGGRIDPEDARKLQVISKNSEKMGQLIDDLLQLSRTGRVEIHLGQLNLKSLVQDVWKEILAGNQNRNMEIIIGDLPPARGDSTLLRQVFSNLLGNAVKFTKDREKAVIEVTGLNSGEFNTYCIKDNGAGFDMKYYDKLFEVFRRLHSENQYEGTGVGLAIVKKIIDRHGGRIWAESKYGEGATFYFTLPAAINPQV